MREILQQIEGLPEMPGGYDIVTIDNKVHVVAWRGTHLFYVCSESAPTREEAIANMRTLLAKQRVLGNESVISGCRYSPK